MVAVAGEPALVAEFRSVAEAAGLKITVGKARSAGRSARSTPLCGVELTNIDLPAKEKNLRMLDRLLPRETVIFSSSLTVTAAVQATWMKHPERLIGFAALPTLLGGRLFELAPTIHTSRRAMQSAAAVCARLGKEVSVVQDRIGLVLPRVLAMLVNEASFALMEQIAAPSDIDTAMRLGTNYPRGPIAWGDAIGLNQIVALLDALQHETGEERYRVAPLLRQLSVGNPWWRT